VFIKNTKSDLIGHISGIENDYEVLFLSIHQHTHRRFKTYVFKYLVCFINVPELSISQRIKSVGEVSRTEKYPIFMEVTL